MASASTHPALRVGIVGCGRVTTEWHLPALARVSEAEVVAVADLDRGRAEAVARRFGVEAVHPSAEALIEASGAQAVAVCVPASEHVAVARMALGAGLHVLVEKPLALSVPDADELIRRAETSAGIAAVGFNLRRHRLVRRAREAVRAGAVGSVSLASSTFASASRRVPEVAEWRKRRALGGGVVLEQAIHHFDLWRFLLDTEITRVSAYARGDDEHVAVCAETASGAVLTGSFSDGTSPSNEVSLIGSGGRLELSCYRVDGLEVIPVPELPGEPRARLRRGAELVRALPQEIAAMRGGGDHRASYLEQWRAFVAAARGHAPSDSTLLDGRQALAVALAVLEATESGRSVEVDVPDRELERSDAAASAAAQPGDGSDRS